MARTAEVPLIAGEAPMSDSHGGNASQATNVPQAHDVFPGRLRGNVAGGPDTSGSSAGMAQMEMAPLAAALMEAATDDNMRRHLLPLESACFDGGARRTCSGE